MENEELEEQGGDILTLTSPEGEDVDFEYLDTVPYEGKRYVVLIPVESENEQVFIFEVSELEDGTDDFLMVEEDSTLDAVFALFKERNQDLYEFDA